MAVGVKCKCGRQIKVRPEKTFHCVCGEKHYLENFVPPTPVTIRHCIYHVYAAKKNDIWWENIRRMRKYLDAFNGKRVCAISCDATTHSYSFLKSLMERYGFRCYEFPNDYILRETLTFPSLLNTVYSKEGFGKIEAMTNY